MAEKAILTLTRMLSGLIYRNIGPLQICMLFLIRFIIAAQVSNGDAVCIESGQNIFVLLRSLCLTIKKMAIFISTCYQRYMLYFMKETLSLRFRIVIQRCVDQCLSIIYIYFDVICPNKILIIAYFYNTFLSYKFFRIRISKKEHH